MSEPWLLPQRALAALALLSAAALLAPAAAAQRSREPLNAPSLCPYCGGDPARMAPAGIASHGGFEFGLLDTAAQDEFLVETTVYWIESEHFELGLAIPPYKLPQDEKEKLRAELERLALVLPEVPLKPRVLDPWLRVHLFAQRVEDQYRQMLELLQVEESDFPDGSTPWDRTGEYMGEGPYLGQKGKYEVLVLPTEASHVAWLRKEFGLSTKRAQRWNVIERDSLNSMLHLQEGHLRKDVALHCAVAFNVTHMLIDGYKHYSYDTPIWLHEGLAHWFSRNIHPKYNSYDSSEGGIAELSKKWRWHKEVLELVRKDEAPRMAELMATKSYADLDMPFHLTTWSMVSYLIEVHPDGFARHLRNICGILDANGIADGSRMSDRHRESLEECTGMSYVEFDRAWRDWAQGIEPEEEEDGLFGG